MSRPSRTVVLLPIATRTTSGTGDAVIFIEGFTAARIHLDINTVSGTSPTLDVYVQNGMDTVASGDANAGDKCTGALIWNDFAHFTQATTSDTDFFIGVVGGGNFAAAAQAKALAAATVRNGPLGSHWRVAWTHGGTSPSFSCAVAVELIP